MSAGNFVTEPYTDNFGNIYPVKTQPETASLTLATVVNAPAAVAIPANIPSASISKGRRSNGVNTRLVRVRFTGTLPDGYAANGILTLPVYTSTTFDSYGKGQTGTYTLNGTAYDVEYVGKTAESII